MRRSFTRIMLWIGAGLAAFIAVGLAAVWIYSQTDSFRALVRNQALAALNENIEGEVAFDSLTGSIWRAVEIHGLSIKQNGAEVLAAPVVTIRLSLLRQAIAFLYSSHLHVSAIDIRSPAVLAIQNQNKQWNLASLLRKKKPDEPEKRSISVFLDGIKIAGGKIEARFADGRVARVAEFVFDGSAALLPEGIRADAARLDFLLSTTGFPDARWQIALSFDGAGPPSAEIRRLSLRTLISEIEAIGNIKNFAQPVANLKLNIKKAAAEEIKTLLPSLPLREDFAGEFSVEGPLNELKIDGHAAFADGKLRAAAVVDLSRSAPRFRGAVQAERVVVDKVFTVAAGATVSGSAAFNGTSAADLQAKADAQVSDLRVQGWQVGVMNVSGTLKDNVVTLSSDSKSSAGQAQLQGRIALTNPPTYDLTVKARDFDAQKVARDPKTVPVAARLNADLTIKGRGTDPKKAEADVRLALMPSRVGQVALAEGAAAAKLRGGVLYLDAARLRSEDTTVTARGRIGLFETKGDNQITYQLHAKEIRPWLALAGLQGGGSVDADGSAAGALANPRLDGKAKFANLSLAGNTFQSGTLNWSVIDVTGAKLAGRIRAAANGAEVGIPLRTLEANVALQGKEPIAAQIDLAAQDREQRRHRLRAAARYFPDRIETQLQELSLAMPSGAWRNAKPAQIVVRGKTADIDELVLQRGNQTVRASGIVGLQGEQNFHLQLARLPLDDLHQIAPVTRDAAGLVDADVRVRGTAQSPQVDGKMSLANLTVAGQRYAGLNATAAYDAQRLKMEAQLRQDDVHTLTANGVLPVDLAWGEKKTAKVTGDADVRLYSQGISIAFLGLATKEVEKLDGLVVIDVRLRGPADALAPSGRVDLSGARARIPSLGVSVTDVDLRTTLAPGTITVARVYAKSGAGVIAGAGRIGVAQYKVGAFELLLDAENFQVINTREYKAGATGKLNLTGSLQNPVLTGELTVTDSKLQPDLARFKQKGPPPRDPTIVVVQAGQPVPPPKPAGGTNDKTPMAQQPALYQRLRMDVNVRIPRGTWIYLDDGSVDIMGELRARKDPGGEPTLVGSIQSVRGSYTFEGRKFNFERAEVAFTGGTPLDPRLDIQAHYHITDYDIYLVVGGTAKQPTLTLKSTPQMEQADIFSVLLYGKPAGALTEGQQNALQSEAIKATAGFIAGGLRQSVARHLGLDTLNVEVATPGSPGKVAAGKYVRDNVYVSASQELGGDKQQEYSVEYQISSNWQIKGSTESGRNSGIDLFWHKRY
jgi:autotransporter translocation and assembly factor TamB